MDMNVQMDMDHMDHQIPYNPLEIDLMKRAMDPSSYDPSSLNSLGGSKKPRYNSSINGAKTAPPNNAAFENYGYGPSSSLYSTPSNNPGQGSGMGNLNAMTTPNSAPATTAAPPSPYVYGGGGGMNGMNMNMMMGGMGGMGMMPGMGSMGLGGMNMMSPLSPVNTSSFAGTSQMPQSAGGYSPQLANFSGMGLGGMGGGMGMGMGLGSMGMGLASPALGGGFGNVPINLGVGPGGAYSGAVAAAAAAAANNATGRTVYIGSLPPDASVDELLNQVHFGPIESIRVLPSKSCVFLSFLDGATAAAFHADATIRKLSLHNHELKIGWGKASPVPAPVLMAISQSGASRNVYLGGLDEGMTEEQLRDDLSRFGLIDQVKIVRDKNIGFVHFLSIATATKVVATLPTEPNWAGKRINYGKDRCAYIPKSQQAAAAAAQVAAAQSLVAHSYLSSGATPSSATFGEIGNPSNPSPANLSVMAQAAVGTSLNRTIYLGNISPETSIEDLCNAIRGGVLQSIRYLQDKHIAFVTFIDPAAAIGFFQAATFSANPNAQGGGLMINGRRVKVGWGKNSGPLPTQIAVAVHGGATRNVYVGNIGESEWDIFNDAKLRNDFGEFGEIELVNYLKEKNCAFVNFTNIQSAMKAIEGIKSRPEYGSLRVSYGKDRCANPPRLSNYSSGGGGMRRPRENSGDEGGKGVKQGMDGDDELGDGLGMEDVDAYTKAEVEGLVDA